MVSYKLQSFFFLVLSTSILACNGQIKNTEQAVPVTNSTKTKIVGGGCDGCELMYIDMPDKITSTDTSSGWKEEGQQLLVKGIVYKNDGKTPAAGVIIYYWQTDNNGRYTPLASQSSSGRRHGHIRGWVKCDERGQYRIYTIRPAPYPGLKEPAHIHFSIKEPDLANEYYIDDIQFTDDKLVTAEYRNTRLNRGGNGIVKLKTENNLSIAERDIILGMNITDYPEK